MRFIFGFVDDSIRKSLDVDMEEYVSPVLSYLGAKPGPVWKIFTKYLEINFKQIIR